MEEGFDPDSDAEADTDAEAVTDADTDAEASAVVPDEAVALPVVVSISIPGIPSMSDIPPISMSIEVDVDLPETAEVVAEAREEAEPSFAVDTITFSRYEKEEILSICSSLFFASKAATWVSNSAKLVELEHCPLNVGPSSETITSTQLYMNS